MSEPSGAHHVPDVQTPQARARLWRRAGACCFASSLASSLAGALALGSRPALIKSLAASVGISYAACAVSLLLLGAWLGAGCWSWSISAMLRLEAEESKRQRPPP